MWPETQTAASGRTSFTEGWPGVLLIAATYIYFLIFAQFGFLKRLAELGFGEATLPIIMGAMAAGGIGMSLLAPRTTIWECPSCRLQTGLGGCLLAALWAVLPLNLVTAACTAFTIGASLGLLTVTLVAHLPLWIGRHSPLFKIALGTGLGYFFCNFPPLFTAAPGRIALVSAGVCLIGLVVARSARLLEAPAEADLREQSRQVPFALVLAWFTALVWLDSAAFYIIQNSPLLKAGTWQGDLHLWRAGILHLLAALVSAWLLARRGIATTLGLALAVLGGACLLLLEPSRVAGAGLLYPIGVSLYSVALVAYPAFLLASGSAELRARRAGVLYAVAGWIGSAMGIGMARNLHHVPPAFVVAAVCLFVTPLLWDVVHARRLNGGFQRQILVIGVLLATAYAVTQWRQPVAPPVTGRGALSSVERGRRVYIAEGCINCHSQYVRPNTSDVPMWGPVRSMEEIRREQPPLIGNRRQGPDLSEVGARRSPLWLRMHFMNPRTVSYDSIMPRYDYLFNDRRGDDLMAYLGSLDDPGHWREVEGWKLPEKAWTEAAHLDGERLYGEHCATCHNAQGAARKQWFTGFRRLPLNLAEGQFTHVDRNAPVREQREAMAHIVKFGIEGTDMPGHEYLSDAEVAALSEEVLRMRQAAVR